MSPTNILQVIGQHYGGLAATSDPAVELPFVLRKETVEVSGDGVLLRVLEPAVERVQPQCPHFGCCGGCQYQMIETHQQGDVKRRILFDQLQALDIQLPAEIPAHTAQGYGYRNRIRLRCERLAGELRFGYNERGTTNFLPVVTCPIAAPVLWSAAEALLAAANEHIDTGRWMQAASEVELFCNHDLTQVQVTLLCAPRTKVKQGSLARSLAAVQQRAPQTVGLAAVASDPRTGPTGRTLDAAGAPGLAYTVGDETYWISRGAFFQVNRFLLEPLVKLVCEKDGVPRVGTRAWDLYAGVGLFSRVLARAFTRVVAVEANPAAAVDNRNALRRLSAAHEVRTLTTLEFLRAVAVQREKPALIVLDPPRAGAGAEVCELLLRMGAPEIVYVSCDPVTLARDLAVLQRGYRITSLQLVDLFPQTFHLETVVVLEAR
jgi:23S rRNA (uracil1939-C5)-methyltransferase